MPGKPKTPEAAARKALHQFKPGQSGNPSGTPKGKRISTWMIELGQLSKAELKKIAPTLPVNGLIALARVKAAMKERFGEHSTDILLDRTEGRVKQMIGIEAEPPMSLEKAQEILSKCQIPKP